MLYKYKWALLIAWLVMVLWIGYVIDLTPRQLQYRTLKETQTRLAINWQQTQAKTQDMHPSWVYSPDESSFLSFTKQIQKANLQIMSVKTVTATESHFVLHGSCQAWQDFLHVLVMERFVFELKNVVMKQDKGHTLSIELDIVLPLNHVGLNRVHQMSLMQDQQFAFCDGVAMPALTRKDEVHLLKTTSIYDMKMSAYLAQDEHAIAWVELPDHTLMEIFLSAVIGQEKATVTNIQPRSISFMLPNHTTFSISMLS
jgi:hypothetical protein